MARAPRRREARAPFSPAARPRRACWRRPMPIPSSPRRLCACATRNGTSAPPSSASLDGETERAPRRHQGGRCRHRAARSDACRCCAIAATVWPAWPEGLHLAHPCLGGAAAARRGREGPGRRLDKQHRPRPRCAPLAQQRVQTEREAENTWRKERAEAHRQARHRRAGNPEGEEAPRPAARSLAPIDGTVTNLAAWTVGGVVKPGDTMLNVVPLSATPEIEARC